MFRRKDGTLVPNVDPLFRIIPIIMKERSDAQIFYSYDIPIKALEEYIEEKRKENINISYLHIVYAAIIRTIAKREKLNRFVMNGRVYKRNDIILTMTAKKSLSDDAPETNLKIKFKGNETVEEVKDLLNKEIENFKVKDNLNEQDKFVDIVGGLPFWLFKLGVNTLMRMDKWNMLPKPILDLSPFHSSAYVTNVGSIGVDSIYHHIYNFGTVGIFLAMGKKKKTLIYEDDVLKEEKAISFSFVLDERICDGYYFANSIRMFNKYLKNPHLLDKNEDIEENVEDILEQVAPKE